MYSFVLASLARHGLIQGSKLTSIWFQCWWNSEEQLILIWTAHWNFLDIFQESYKIQCNSNAVWMLEVRCNWPYLQKDRGYRWRPNKFMTVFYRIVLDTFLFTLLKFKSLILKIITFLKYFIWKFSVHIICDSLVIISCQLMFTLMSQIGLNKVSPPRGVTAWLVATAGNVGNPYPGNALWETRQDNAPMFSSIPDVSRGLS